MDNAAKERNRNLSVRWKAQHGLVVAFFTLLLYVHVSALNPGQDLS